ncbi:hypothetical protein AVEN_25184-1 [Araneus ventricosus]|uniref:Uncharacterized protein n=1 Tax=Araneus ventricosus TaxID=182803 RepID=A0A4Y2T9L5_ARAVE|nr:hypothetical protein AVEN_25184-1 [Araneus ventricosus]
MLRDLSEDYIKSLINSDTTPIREIQKFSCHMQTVERCIKLVTEASNKVCGREARDDYIRATLKSRSVMPNFSKKADFKCLVDIKKKKEKTQSKPKNPTLWKIFVNSYKYNVNTTPNNWMVGWVGCGWNSMCNHLHVIYREDSSTFEIPYFVAKVAKFVAKMVAKVWGPAVDAVGHLIPTPVKLSSQP